MRQLPEPRHVQILEVLFKRKVAIACFALGTLLAGFFLSVSTYRAEVQILLGIGREHVVDPSLHTAGAIRPSVRFEQNEQTALASELLQGRTLAEQVVDRLGATKLYELESDADARETPEQRAVRMVRKKIDVSTAGHSTLLKLRFEHEDRDTAALVANTLADEFLARHAAIRKDVEQQAFFAEQLDLRRNELDAAQKDLETFKREHGITGGTAADARAHLNAQLQELELEQSKAAIEIADLRARVAHLQSVRDQTRRLDGSDFSLLSGKSVESLLNSLVNSLAQLRGLNSREAAIVQQISGVKSRLSEVDAVSNDFSRLDAVVQMANEQYELHLAKSNESQFSEAMDSYGISSVRIVERAVPPRKPVSNRVLLLLLALVLGGTGGIVWAFALEAVSGTIDTPSDADRYLGAPAIVAIPEFTTR